MVVLCYTVQYNNPEMRNISGRPEAARSWARAVANSYRSPLKTAASDPTIEIKAHNCPQGLSPTQADLVRNITGQGCYAARPPNPNWYHHEKPSDFLTEAHGRARVNNLAEPISKIGKNRELVDLMDECIIIGYQTTLTGKSLAASAEHTSSQSRP